MANQRSGIPMWFFLVMYVVLSTSGPVYWHWKTHSVVNPTQVALVFFLGLNAIVCLWEMCLCKEIVLIEKKHRVYAEKYKGRATQLALDFFFLDVNFSNLFSSKLWAEVSEQ
jgi:hypothetical protein